MKQKIILSSIIFLTIIGSGFMLFSASTASAEGTSIYVAISKDKCWNIPGIQLTVPEGMVVDANNDCATPPPPPIDVCANISGNQATIPSGYYRDGDGNCYVQPVEQIDVCPNIDGLQEIIPSGYVNDGNGNCILAPVDQCPNIDGVQTSIPTGMTRDDQGNCGTPPFVVVPTEPLQPTIAEPTIVNAVRVLAPNATPKNVSETFAPVVKPLVDVVPEPIKQVVRSLPPVVAQTFPYYIFAALGLLASFMWVQAIGEASAAQRFIKLLKRERSIAEQKDNFIALASHYLQTPLAVMSNGLDAIQALKEISPAVIEPLRTPLKQLSQDITSILKEVEGNLNQSDNDVAEDSLEKASFLKSPYFWWPVAGSIAIVGGANFLLGVVGEVEIGTINILTQIAILLTVIFFLYSALRNHYTRKRNRTKQEELLARERTIDETRNVFLARSTKTLQDGLTQLGTLRPAIDAAPSAKFFDDGYSRFATILGKFTLLSQLQAGAQIQMQPLSLHEAVDIAITRRMPEADAKQLSLTNSTPQMMINQHNELFQFVIDSLLDNAIKFTEEGGTIDIGAAPSTHKISISVTDSGVGIPTEKQSQLFKPFSRTESAVEFNYEGLGFSLFLDKIIMDYLGGDISVESKQRAGSTFTITSEPVKGTATRPVMTTVAPHATA